MCSHSPSALDLTIALSWGQLEGSLRWGEVFQRWATCGGFLRGGVKKGWAAKGLHLRR